MNNIFRISKRSDIQIFRAFAVLIVIFYHSNPELFPYGYLGVDIFFVISGFLISNIIFSQIDNESFKIKNFFINRFRRIVPSLVSFIIFTQLLAYFFIDNQHIHSQTLGNLYSLFFISNVYFSQLFEYFSEDSSRNLIINLWSLSVEEQFYLAFPFLALLIKKVNFNKRFLIFCFLFFTSLLFLKFSIFSNVSLLKYIFSNYDNYLFYSPFTRAWQFLLGVIAMFLNQRKRASIKTNNNIFLIYQLFFYFLISSNFSLLNNFYRLIASMVFIFIFLIYETKIEANKNLVIILFLYIGNISYSLYLFHQPIFASIRNYQFYSQNYKSIFYDFHQSQNFLLVLLIVFTVSIINFRLVESKFRNKPDLHLKNFKNFYLMSLLALILLSVSLNSNGYAFRNNEVMSFSESTDLKFITGTNYIIQDNNHCLDRDTLKNTCRFNNIGSSDKIYVFGDSIMSSLVSGFVSNNKFKNYEIIEYTKGSCPLLIDYCNFSNDSVYYDEIMSIKNSTIVLGGDYKKFNNDENFQDKISETIVNLLKGDNKILILKPIPNPGYNTRMYAQFNETQLNFQMSEWINKTRNVNNALDSINFDNLIHINSEEAFCNVDNCIFTTDSFFYYIDHAHLSFFGAEKIVDYISKFIEN